MENRRVILTCFAGRRRNMELLLSYADELYSRGLIEGMHIWDFSRDSSDGEWLSRTFQRCSYIFTRGYDYVRSGVVIGPGERGEMMFKCSSGAHILVSAGRDPVAEVVFGAYWNSCDFLRDGPQGTTLDHRGSRTCDMNRWRTVGFVVDEAGLVSVDLDGEVVLRSRLVRTPEFPLSFSVAGWESSEVQWRLPDFPAVGFKHPYARLFRVRNKGSWREYYQHYTDQLYPDRVIVKSDDDIVFIDVESFSRFIDLRLSDDSLLLFPSIVNNGFCARHQRRLGYIDDRLPHGDGFSGRLWGDGVLCQRLHEYFHENHEWWLAKARSDLEIVRVPMGERVSINFFAIRSVDLYAFQMVWDNDEVDLTMELPRKLRRTNSMSVGMTVSHLAFYRQRETGLDEGSALKLYGGLAGLPGSVTIPVL